MADPLGPLVIINYLKFILSFNLVGLVESYSNIHNATSFLDHSNTFPYLFFELSEVLINKDENLKKLIWRTIKNKRGLINGLGSTVQLISVNIEQEDLDHI